MQLLPCRLPAPPAAACRLPPPAACCLSLLLIGSAAHPLAQTQTLLKDQLEVVRLKQPDGTTRFSIKPLDCEFSFDKGFFMFIRAIQLLTQHNKDTTLVRRRRAGSRAGSRAGPLPAGAAPSRPPALA